MLAVSWSPGQETNIHSDRRAGAPDVVLAGPPMCATLHRMLQRLARAVNAVATISVNSVILSVPYETHAQRPALKPDRTQIISIRGPVEYVRGQTNGSLSG